VLSKTAGFTREAKFTNLLSKYEVLKKKNFFELNTEKKGNTQQNLILKIQKHKSHVVFEISRKTSKIIDATKSTIHAD